jgi:hypothetical protein
MEVVKHKGIKFRVWDLGGNNQFKLYLNFISDNNKILST